MERRTVASGSSFEEAIGFARAVRVGSLIYVSGTAPVWPDGSCAPDVSRQAARCLEIVGEALAGLGAALTDVVRTRVYIKHPGDAEAVAVAHREVFGASKPAATMVVVAGLLDPRWKVEIEADAVVGEPAG